MFKCKTIEEARKHRDEIISDYKDIAENAMICLDEGFEDAMTVMVLPRYLHKYFRTSNQIERLNKELKWRSKVIGVLRATRLYHLYAVCSTPRLARKCLPEISLSNWSI